MIANDVLVVASQAGRKYEIFAPSHPQAVNQFIRDYNYSIEPKQDKNKDLYDKAVARKYILHGSTFYC